MKHSIGGFFDLNARPSVDVDEELPNGWSARLRRGSKLLEVASSTPARRGYVDSLDASLEAAQKTLDLLSIRGESALTLQDCETSHAVWWTEPRGTVLKSLTLADIVGPTFSGTGIVISADGVPLPSEPRPILEWHPSFRYFRLSQTTSDLVDSFRNVYLAFESLLSTIVPLKSPSEREGDWLKRALQHVNNTIVDLSGFCRPGAIDPTQDVFEDLVSQTRNRLFHAKWTGNTLLPHEIVSRKDVTDSLTRLSRLYLTLARDELKLKRRGSSTSVNVFERLTDRSLHLVLSDDDSPGSSRDTVINPRGGSKVELPTTVDANLTARGRKFWIGETTVSGMRAQMAKVTRVGLLENETPWFIWVFEELLPVDRFDILQVEVGLRFVHSPHEPRWRFAT